QTVMGQVSGVKTGGGGFVVTAYGNQYKSKALILAFGKTPMDLSVPGEEEFKGRGLSYCASCDAPLFKNKIVAVAGIGDINLEAALLVSKFAKRVYLLSKTDKLVGHPALLKAVAKKNNIEILPFVRIDSIAGKGTLNVLELTDLKLNRRRVLPVDGLFVELGYVVNSDFVKDLVDLDEQGQIKVNADQSTSMEGVFAAGDAVNRPYKQAVISAGEGAAAALAAYDWLMKKQGGAGLTSDWTQIKKVK
ncbi:MAG TPA: FAD-dependent oxidoreductase, partial [Patescibacteria group bacterium]|nr:FAD-dependent oxidoreductase [Patescibacteria group bacterium]